MSKLPAFQFYPNDWLSNTKLRRCSLAARGAWMDVLCILHDSDEYGLVRYPLKELAQATGVPVRILNELISKDVLKGSDKGCDPFIYTPRSGRRDGTPVELISKTEFPLWFSSRLVKDNYIRKVRGSGTRFESENTTISETPKPTPKPHLGDTKSDGPSSSSSSSTSVSTLCLRARDATCDFFGISEMKNASMFFQITAALEKMEGLEKLVYYIDQLEKYKIFKQKSEQKPCGITSWIWGRSNGTIDEGHWCREDYSLKLKSIESNSNSKTPRPDPKSKSGELLAQAERLMNHGK